MSEDDFEVGFHWVDISISSVHHSIRNGIEHARMESKKVVKTVFIALVLDLLGELVPHSDQKLRFDHLLT